MGNTILLADKSITIQKIVQLTFADENYNIQCVSDGQSALDLIPQLQPDIVLLDISLPGKNGYDVCRTIRTDPSFSSFSATPIVLLAGIYETMDEERARQVELRVQEVAANDFLSKPFDPQVLIAKVKQFLGPSKQDADIFSSQAAVPQHTFAEASGSAELFNESEISAETYSEQPPDDGERTMMIPGGISFGANMFADQPNFEEQQHEPVKPAVDPELVKPVDEMIFGEEQFASMAEEPEEEVFTQEVEAVNDFFMGRQEPELEMPPPLEEPSLAAAEPPSVTPLILSEAEEPFGEVFDAPAPAAAWTPAVVSEEDAPFGLPEPPPVQTVEESFEPQLQAENDVIEATPQEDDAQPMEIVSPQLSPAEPPEGYDDTWPGVPGRMDQPVEELFEIETASAVDSKMVDEAEELEADASAVVPGIEEITAPQEPISVAAPSAAVPLELTDELVEKIAERVVAKLSERIISEIVWQVVPDLAERMIRREIEKLHEGEQ